jgi:hypothetical protein
MTCHGQFRATNMDDSRPYLRDEYVSRSDGKTWEEVYQEVEAMEPADEIGLHDIHRHIMLDKFGSSRCNVCHARSDPPVGFGGFYPVSLDFSETTDLEPISCMGCHGRNEDDAAEENLSSVGGRGAGLRQHHTNAGIPVCKTCHWDADPANYTPVGEDVLPPYYAAPNDVFPNKPTDPCNRKRDEDYAGKRFGLDNDGDGKYDRRDRDCKGN